MFIIVRPFAMLLFAGLLTVLGGFEILQSWSADSPHAAARMIFGLTALLPGLVLALAASRILLRAASAIIGLALGSRR